MDIGQPRQEKRGGFMNIAQCIVLPLGNIERQPPPANIRKKAISHHKRLSSLKCSPSFWCLYRILFVYLFLCCLQYRTHCGCCCPVRFKLEEIEEQGPEERFKSFNCCKSWNSSWSLKDCENLKTGRV
jgi:hypothetical protein